MITARTILLQVRSDRFWALSDQLMVSGTAFLTTLLTAHELNIQQFGWFSSVMLVQLLVLAVQNALVTNPFQVLQATAKGQKGKSYRDSLLFVQLGFTVVLLMPILAIFIIQPTFLQPLQGAWWYISLSVAGFLVQDFQRRALVADNRAAAAFSISALNGVLQLTGLAYLYNSESLSLNGCFFVIGLSSLPAIALGWYWHQPGAFQFSEIMASLRLHVEHGKWLLLTVLLQWWSGNIFVVAAGAFAGVEAFAAVRLTQNIFGVMGTVFQIAENSVLPNAARMYSRSSELLTKYLRSSFVKSSRIVLLLLLLIIVFAKPILRIAGGEEYVRYHFIIYGMALLYFIIYLNYAVRIAIRVLSLNKVFFTGYLLSSVFSFSTAYMMVRQWGIYGVVTGLIISQMLAMIYWVYILKKKNLILWK